jgi:hypothetical protein
MQNDRLTLDDVLEHRADCHFFLQEPTGVDATEQDIRNNERLAMRFARTFGTEGQWRTIQGMIMKLRMKRRTKNDRPK